MNNLDEKQIWCPLHGEIVPLETVEDPMFREEMLGTTICLDPSESTIFAPFDGIVSVMYPSAHAVGMIRDDGLEILIHVGINTVELNGLGFVSQVEQGDKVRAYTPLMKFDKQLIQEKGYSSQVFIVFTNSKDFQLENIPLDKEMNVKEVLCHAKKL